MSDCPDCDNTGWAEDGEGNPMRCTGWRHRCRPTLDEIALALKEGRDPPRSYMLPKGGK